MIGGSSRGRHREFSFHHRVQTDSEHHPTSCPMAIMGYFPGGKAAEAWIWPLTSI